MKKITFCILAAFFVLSVIPTQIKAATKSNPVAVTSTTDIKSAGSNVDAIRLSEIKSIDMPALNSTENKEALKKGVSPLNNDQEEHSRGYKNRHQQRNVDATITSEHQTRGDGANQGRHSHVRAYIGGCGIIIIIIMLILIN